MGTWQIWKHQTDRTIKENPKCKACKAQTSFTQRKFQHPRKEKLVHAENFRLKFKKETDQMLTDGSNFQRRRGILCTWEIPILYKSTTKLLLPTPKLPPHLLLLLPFSNRAHGNRNPSTNAEFPNYNYGLSLSTPFLSPDSPSPPDHSRFDQWISFPSPGTD